tara:strand:- start:711 stop:1292 length:582 start_codon:yes stop_codon:yes gene_type:complete
MTLYRRPACINFDDSMKSIINWCIKNPFVIESTLSRKEKNKQMNINEKKWGNQIIGRGPENHTSQWTTILGESIVAEVLSSQGHTVYRPKNMNGYKPDWEIENAIIEVKTRSWTTSGTAGEKVFGVPYKYAEIPKLYGKPLKIVCVAYQECELMHGKTRVFGDDISTEKKEMLAFWKERNIEFVKFSDIINKF